jgi:hypothetical protein
MDLHAGTDGDERQQHVGLDDVVATRDGQTPGRRAGDRVGPDVVAARRAEGAVADVVRSDQAHAEADALVRPKRQPQLRDREQPRVVADLGVLDVGVVARVPEVAGVARRVGVLGADPALAVPRGRSVTVEARLQARDVQVQLGVDAREPRQVRGVQVQRER